MSDQTDFASRTSPPARFVGLVVRPVRFTSDVPAMQAFLETLGLAARIESESGGWVDLVAGAGMVALHGAATSDTGVLPGQTRLSFEADDLDALAAALIDAGHDDAHVVDESDGRLLVVTDPDGEQLIVDGASDDLYGYRAHLDRRPDERLTVVPVRFTQPTGPYAGFLSAFGFAPMGEPDEYYMLFNGADSHGMIGLHHLFGAVLPVVAGPGAIVQLTFTTTEPAPDIAARLDHAGYDRVEIRHEDFGDVVSVVDPDGQDVQVHPR
jgi:hypothetical protein